MNSCNSSRISVPVQHYKRWKPRIRLFEGYREGELIKEISIGTTIVDDKIVDTDIPIINIRGNPINISGKINISGETNIKGNTNIKGKINISNHLR